MRLWKNFCYPQHLKASLWKNSNIRLVGKSTHWPTKFDVFAVLVCKQANTTILFSLKLHPVHSLGILTLPRFLETLSVLRRLLFCRLERANMSVFSENGFLLDWPCNSHLWGYFCFSHWKEWFSRTCPLTLNKLQFFDKSCRSYEIFNFSPFSTRCNDTTTHRMFSSFRTSTSKPLPAHVSTNQFLFLIFTYLCNRPAPLSYTNYL